MWKFLPALVVPKILGWIEEGYHYFFDDNEEPVKASRDTTKLTLEQANYIREYRKCTKGTAEVLTNHFNDTFKLNKSKSSYARIWHKDYDITKHHKSGQ